MQIQWWFTCRPRLCWSSVRITANTMYRNNAMRKGSAPTDCHRVSRLWAPDDRKPLRPRPARSMSLSDRTDGSLCIDYFARICEPLCLLFTYSIFPSAFFNGSFDSLVFLTKSSFSILLSLSFTKFIFILWLYLVDCCSRFLGLFVFSNAFIFSFHYFISIILETFFSSIYFHSTLISTLFTHFFFSLPK